MNQVHVTICTGTACYVMGGADLLGAVDILLEKYGDRVVCEGSTCLGYCKLGKQHKAPFVKVNDRLLAEATVESLEKAVEEALGTADGDGLADADRSGAGKGECVPGPACGEASNG
jgi:NADH:ubiquinone oxidoreductase subunit E